MHKVARCADVCARKGHSVHSVARCADVCARKEHSVHRVDGSTEVCARNECYMHIIEREEMFRRRTSFDGWYLFCVSKMTKRHLQMPGGGRV